MGAVVVDQHIHPQPPEVVDISKLQEAAEIGDQIHVGVVPGEMDHLDPHPVQQGGVVRRDEPDVQPLGEVHPRTAVRQLQDQLFVVRAGQKVGVQQLDLPLAVPELGQVGHLTAPPPLLTGNNTKSAVSGASTGQKSVGGALKLRI